MNSIGVLLVDVAQLHIGGHDDLPVQGVAEAMQNASHGHLGGALAIALGSLLRFSSWSLTKVPLLANFLPEVFSQPGIGVENPSTNINCSSEAR